MPSTNFTAHLSASDREALQAAAELHDAINTHVTTAAAAGLDTTQICQTYQNIRPSLEKYLPYIGFIPVIGSTAATAIRGLMTLLDALCGSKS